MLLRNLGINLPHGVKSRKGIMRPFYRTVRRYTQWALEISIQSSFVNTPCTGHRAETRPDSEAYSILTN